MSTCLNIFGCIGLVTVFKFTSYSKITLPGFIYLFFLIEVLYFYLDHLSFSYDVYLLWQCFDKSYAA